MENANKTRGQLLEENRNLTHQLGRLKASVRDNSTNADTARILELIAIGRPASEIYDEIALLYEKRHPGMRCSMLELHGNILLHGGAPSLPKEYCDAVHGLENGPDVGSCGTSTYTGKRVLVDDIATDPKWADIRQYALPHGLRSCWSEPIKDSSAKVLGAFGMYYNHPALPDAKELSDLQAAARLAGIVMERDHDHKRIRELAFTDELTGLASRANFYRHLEELIKTSKKNDQRFAVLYIDLDNFKDVNDSLGHHVGDQLLREMGNRLLAADREMDFVARLSGDEFSILVENITEECAATRVAQRCLQEIARPVKLSNRSLTHGCSIGIALYPDHGKELPLLLKAADLSLYAAKKSGKNRYAFYQPDFTRAAEYRFQVEHDLRAAIENHGLTLVYQPQVDVRSGEVVGVEALSRWKHPDFGEISPVEFIAMAERIGMIRALTESVLHTACAQSVVWKKAGIHNLRVAVNISPGHFLDPGFISMVKHVIDSTGMPPGNLELEVTEGAVQTDPKNLESFRSLKSLGVLLGIDDFGTGYSSFASLKHLTVDHLKIDKYFIDDIQNDGKSLSLVAAMIEMGHNLGYKIIAEGVETSEQFSLLKTVGCELVQGSLFGEPVSAEEITKLLTGSRRTEAPGAIK